MNLDPMFLVGKSIVLSLGLCEPPDQMGAKFCGFRFLHVVSRCLEILTLLETASNFQRKKSEIYKIQKKQNIKHKSKSPKRSPV